MVMYHNACVFVCNGFQSMDINWKITQNGITHILNANVPNRLTVRQDRRPTVGLFVICSIMCLDPLIFPKYYLDRAAVVLPSETAQGPDLFLCALEVYDKGEIPIGAWIGQGSTSSYVIRVAQRYARPDISEYFHRTRNQDANCDVNIIRTHITHTIVLCCNRHNLHIQEGAVLCWNNADKFHAHASRFLKT